MKSILLVVVSIAVFGCSSTAVESPSRNSSEIADEVSGDDVLEMATQFASCAGLFEALGEYAKPHDPDLAEVSFGNARGAKVASQYIASTRIDGDAALEFSSNLKTVFLDYWRVHADDWGDNIQAELDLCQGLYPLQAEIVQEVRKKAYGFE